MTKFSLFLFIIPITVLFITFILIIIVIRCSVIRCSIVRCSIICYSPVIILIQVESILFVVVAIRSRMETCYKFTILPVIDTNNKILKYVRDWERKKAFNKFSKQLIVRIGSNQASK